VRDLNTRVETFPQNIIASMFHFVRAEYFEVNDPGVRAAPRVSFQDTAGELTVIAETLIGYIDAKSGRKLAFALYVNNLTLPEIEDLFAVFDDENLIAGLLYEAY